MDKLELTLTYKESKELKKPFLAKGLKITDVSYYHCEVKIADEVYTSYVNQFEFFYSKQDLREHYEIVYDVNNFLENEIESAPIITAPQLPKNIILAFEYALIKHYIKHSNHFCFFKENNRAKINYLFQSLKEQDFRSGLVVKYKIAPNPNITQVIHDLEKLTKNKIGIRLDGNRSLDPHQVASLFYNLSEEAIGNIEYIEEPFDSVKKWQELEISQRIPMALDESFNFSQRHQVDEKIDHLILKLGVNCSVFEYFALKKDERDWHITMTSGFEAPKLFNMAIHLASRERTAAGLSTFMFFKNGLKLVKDYLKEESTIEAFGLN